MESVVALLTVSDGVVAAAAAEDEASLNADEGGTNAWQPVWGGFRDIRIYWSGKIVGWLVLGGIKMGSTIGGEQGKHSRAVTAAAWCTKRETELLLFVISQETWTNTDATRIHAAR